MQGDLEIMKHLCKMRETQATQAKQYSNNVRSHMHTYGHMIVRRITPQTYGHACSKGSTTLITRMSLSY